MDISWRDKNGAPLPWTRIPLTEREAWSYELLDHCIREVVGTNQHNGEVAVQAAILSRLGPLVSRAHGAFSRAIMSVRGVEVYVGDSDAPGGGPGGELHVHILTTLGSV